MKTKYYEAIVKWNEKLAENPKTIFLGQQVKSEDFYGTLKNISKHIRLEMPIAEEMQIGVSIGLALEGYLPVSIIQRMDFLPRACDQIVNHLDLMKTMTKGKYNPKVIIRTTVGTTEPFDVGLQHSKDLTEGFKKLVSFPIFNPKTVDEVNEAYEYALSCEGPVMIVEYQALYN